MLLCKCECMYVCVYLLMYGFSVLHDNITSINETHTKQLEAENFRTETHRVCVCVCVCTTTYARIDDNVNNLLLYCVIYFRPDNTFSFTEQIPITHAHIASMFSSEKNVLLIMPYLSVTIYSSSLGCLLGYLDPFSLNFFSFFLSFVSLAHV